MGELLTKLRNEGSLKLHLSMRDGTFRDLSGNGNHGTPNDGAILGKTRNGIGLKCNGSTSFMNCGNDASLNFTDKITAAAWIKASGRLAGTSGIVVAKDDDIAGRAWTFIVQNNGTMDLFGGGGGGVANSVGAIPYGIWTHVAWVYISATSVAYFINGILDTITAVGIPAMVSTTANVYIGGRSFAGSLLPFHGEIDEAIIANDDLTETEVAQLMAETKPRGM